MTNANLLLKHQSYIKKTVNASAFKFYLDADDLLSEMNLKFLSNEMEIKGGDEGFLRFFRVSLKNLSIDKYRRKRFEGLPLEDYHHPAVYQKEKENADLLGQIEAYMQGYGSKKGKTDYSLIFTRILINGEGYQYVADDLNIPVERVKSAVFRTRKLISLKFHNQYLQCIN